MKARRQQCTARVSDGSRQCERWAIKGGTVCATHGGRAPQVKKSAKERLAELIEPALEGLHTALKSREIPSIVKAAQVVLDRTGFHPTHAVELFGKDGRPIEIESTVPIEAIPRWLQLLLLFALGGEDISEDLKGRILREIEGSFDAEYNVISTANSEDFCLSSSKDFAGEFS